MSAYDVNREARINLAVAFRALDKMGLNEGLSNHMSIVAPAIQGTGDVTLINPYGLLWNEIQASSLVGVNDEGDVVEGDGKPSAAAVAIHTGLRQVRPNLRCIMHTHMTYATTLGILEDPRIKLYHQDSGWLYGKVAYHKEYRGIVTGTEEGRELGESLGDCEAMIMQNHGALTCGVNVAAAFDLMYYLERAAMFQVLAYTTGQPLREFSETTAQHICGQYSAEERQAYVDCYFAAIKRKTIKEYPDVLS